jgi:hypothetical protein
MGPINLRVRYRPIRIGWCVQENNLEEYRKALGLTHTLWGGRFNPIIPLGDPDLARLIIGVFRVDCLYCIGQSKEGDAMRSEFKHLPWPGFYEGLFVQGVRGPEATFLDVYHPAMRLYNTHIKDRERPNINGILFRWDSADPLAEVLLATFGAYPPKAETGIDYDAFIQKYLAAQVVNVPNNGALPQAAYKEFTPRMLSGFELRRDLAIRGRDEPGLYHGDSRDFRDLINFWNLRASGIDVLFYDPARVDRFHEITDHYLNFLRERPKDPSGWREVGAIWNKSQEVKIDLTPFGPGLIWSPLSLASWNGLNIRPPLMGFEENAVLGTLSENDRITATFELPSKPFFDELMFHTQKLVVSVHPLVTTENVVFKPPYFPKLNEYYGGESYFMHDAVRSEHEGIGIITEVMTSNLTVHALDVRTLVKKIFEVSGIAAKPSPAGLVGLRLIDQMGGLLGCRVFKIAGVRDLISKYSPEKPFTRGGAITTIGRMDASGKFHFSGYESLYMEGRIVKPDSAFNYLLKQGVFRAGLRLLCPNCELESWIHLDEIRTISRCEYCGKDFNITSQLKDRDWAFRRSGLFGRDDHQGGGIPVALTLQQLQTALHMHVLAYTTGTELEPAGANIEKC